MNETVVEQGKIDFSDERFARRRSRRIFADKAATAGIALGGVSVIIAILLIFIYLMVEVMPLFQGASMEKRNSFRVPVAENDSARTALLSMEEQAEIGVRVTDTGEVIFFQTASGDIVNRSSVALPEGVSITSFARGGPAGRLFAYGLSDGTALILKHDYKVTYPDDKRLITPRLVYPYGEEPKEINLAGEALTHVAIRDDEDVLVIAAATETGALAAVRFEKSENFMTEEITLEPETIELPQVAGKISSLALDIGQDWLFVAVGDNTLNIYNLHQSATLHSQLQLAEASRVTSLEFLLGGISLLAGTEQGRISQWFLVRDGHGGWKLNRIRDFEPLSAAALQIEPEHRRKGFVAVAADGSIGIYNSTANRLALSQHISDKDIRRIGIGPRANALLIEDAEGNMDFWEIDNEHPEISWSALWEKVWYESYQEPDYVWQSSASNNDFEPKLSLAPLTFGTVKAAFYAMLIAAPLAICGAIFTAHFMAPRMRRKVKPLIEVMEALPTVILGFLAGLWLAPYIEHNLPGIFSLLLLTPVCILAVSFVWTQLPGRIRHIVPDGWEAALLIPVVLLAGGFALLMSNPLEAALFGGDMRSWLSNSAGISFDQRNSLVVGLAMGFAVIPTIFSIAEDAIFSVPKHLTNGSLALGATQWQTLTRVVLLTASPGIFSALMIGFGRAVGETMIVLMATGNTPIMDWNIFEGMRTLAANIAVEMPESEVGSTHFRVLFLAALVLFMFTFVVNTFAEIVRQRLRSRYGSL